MPYANPEAKKAAQRRHYEANRERLIEEAKERRRRQVKSGQWQDYLDRTREQRKEYKRQQRELAGAMPREWVTVRAAIRRAGKCPTVARLVYDQQIERWRDHPDERAEHVRQRAIRNARWRYMTDESFRLYHRSKSKRRKAQQRGSTALMLSPDQLWRRWVDFNHTCAYCGAGGDLQVEHLVPISKGGEHHLGNVVPACQRCNFSKGKADALTWYQSQSFFDETRWQRIQDLLARSQPSYEQPSLL